MDSLLFQTLCRPCCSCCFKPTARRAGAGCVRRPRWKNHVLCISNARKGGAVCALRESVCCVHARFVCCAHVHVRKAKSQGAHKFMRELLYTCTHVCASLMNPSSAFLKHTRMTLQEQKRRSVHSKRFRWLPLQWLCALEDALTDSFAQPI